MALRFVEGFDHYTALASMIKKWNGSVGGAFGGSTVTSPVPYSVGRSLQMGNRRDTFSRTLPDHATWIFGFALYPNDTSFDFWIRLRDSGSEQAGFFCSTLRSLGITRGFTGTTLGQTANAAIPLNAWTYIEVKIVVGNSGTYEVRLDGNTTPILSGSGDTQATANANANEFVIGSSSASAGFVYYVDDLYICDGSGGAPQNDFLGNVRVETLYPNGNGASSQWNGSDGDSTNNYLLVDETDPDGETTYVEESTSSDKDTYDYTALTTTSGTIYGVQLDPFVRKTDAGLRQIKSVARESGGTEADSSAVTLNTAYTYWTDVRETKPSGGAWGVSDVNGAQFGVKVV